MKSFLGIFYRHLAIFSGHTACAVPAADASLSHPLYDVVNVKAMPQNVGSRARVRFRQ